jgi:hypothetical protein
VETQQEQIRQLPGWFRQTKIGKALIAENQTLEESERQELVNRIAELRKDDLARMPGLRKAADAALVARDEARRKFEDAQRRLDEANAAIFGTNSAGIAAIENKLRGQVADEITGYRQRIQDRLNEASKALDSHQVRIGYDRLSGTPVFKTVTNAPSVNARRAALLELYRSLDNVIALIPSHAEREQLVQAAIDAAPAVADAK